MHKFHVIIPFQLAKTYRFLVILLIFVLGYSVFSYSMTHSKQPLELKLIWDVFRNGYWGLYGELFLEDGMCIDFDVR